MAEADRITFEKKREKAFRKIGQYITGQAPGTIPHRMLEVAKIPGQLLKGEREGWTPEEALEFSMLGMTGFGSGAGVAGIGVRRFKKVPRLKSTEDALAFGKKATHKQIGRLKELRTESLGKSKIFQKQKAFQSAMDEATRGQFFREALEEAGRRPADFVGARKRKIVKGSKGMSTLADVPHPVQKQIDYLGVKISQAQREGNKAQVDYLKNLRKDVKANKRWLSNFEELEKELGIKPVKPKK